MSQALSVLAEAAELEPGQKRDEVRIEGEKYLECKPCGEHQDQNKVAVLID